MKIDCSNVFNYFKERDRMCNYYIANAHCLHCPLNSVDNGTKKHCDTFVVYNVESALKIIQEWSDTHLQKTYKEDFFEKFPDAENYNGYPSIRTCELYNKGVCFEKDEIAFGCNDCWDKVMEE
ncbi:MAG: hypothetical protein Q4D26_09780 [Clostridia bacterium]|nr:hypothetical protein [Clostridia bacterium]